MEKDILLLLQQEVLMRCQKPSNKFGMEVYYHIESVVKNAKILADRYGADKEVVVIAAWLHDIASITDYSMYAEHHIYGSKIAYEILTELNYDETKIAIVQKCIENHRGSKCKEKISKEEMCVADADAVSHFDSVPSLLYLAYCRKNMSIAEGINFVRNKLERSYRKLSADSKVYYEDKYNNVMSILG